MLDEEYVKRENKQLKDIRNISPNDPNSRKKWKSFGICCSMMKSHPKNLEKELLKSVKNIDKKL